jgi:hypothetical protein
MCHHALRLMLIPISTCLLVFAPTTVEQVRAMQAVTVDQILHAAGAYVQQYEQTIPGVVAQEEYQQVVLPSPEGRGRPVSRTTRAYLHVVDLGRLGWIAFRDVFEVDGRPARQRDERLSKLLTHITPDSLDQARRIAAESARFNLNAGGVTLDRTINTPMTALLFLRTTNQSRSGFRLGKTDIIDGLTVVSLSFNELAKPRLIRSNDGTAARGRFWIDRTTGRVLRSELRMDPSTGSGQSVGSELKVKYAYVAKLDLWLPDTMDESYELRPSRQVINGHATYSDFRQFRVTTTEGVK